MTKNKSLVQSEQNIEDRNTLQPDYQPDSQVEASFADDNLDTFSSVPMSNTIENAQFNMNNPVMPAKEMAMLEKVHEGSVDRVFKINEKEQDFTHYIVSSQHAEQKKITARNIDISKEQNTFNWAKLVIVFILILILIGCSLYLFANDKTWGGLTMAFVSLILASIFVLGHFPDGTFEAMFGKSRNKKDYENIEE